MLNLLCKLAEKIVFSGVNGKNLIPLLICLVWVLKGQAKEMVAVTKKVFAEGR